MDENTVAKQAPRSHEHEAWVSPVREERPIVLLDTVGKTPGLPKDAADARLAKMIKGSTASGGRKPGPRKHYRES